MSGRSIDDASGYGVHTNPDKSQGGRVHRSATIGRNVHISPGCTIHEGVTIGDNGTLGLQVEVHKGAKLGTGVFLEGVNTVGAGAQIGDATTIKAGSKIGAQSFIGPDVSFSGTLEERAAIPGGLKLTQKITVTKDTYPHASQWHAKKSAPAHNASIIPPRG